MKSWHLILLRIVLVDDSGKRFFIVFTVRSKYRRRIGHPQIHSFTIWNRIPFRKCILQRTRWISMYSRCILLLYCHCKKNCASMVQRAKQMGVGLRVHVKVVYPSCWHDRPIRLLRERDCSLRESKTIKRPSSSVQWRNSSFSPITDLRISREESYVFWL